MSHSRETTHWITNHVTTYLSTLPGTSSISLTSPPPPSPLQLQKWEHQNHNNNQNKSSNKSSPHPPLLLPADLKSFYSYCGDGLTFRWYASSASAGIRSGEVLDMRKAVNKYGGEELSRLEKASWECVASARYKPRTLRFSH